MAIIGKPIHRYCKVFSFENLCDVLETLRPLGWAVYGDTFTNAELSAIADYLGSRFSSTGGSLEIETEVVGDPFGDPLLREYKRRYSYRRGSQIISDTIRLVDPDFEFHDREGIKRVLSWESWEVHGPTHVVLPQYLLSSTAPEMFDVNVLFIKEPKKLEMVRTQSLKAPIFVCYVGGAFDAA